MEDVVSKNIIEFIRLGKKVKGFSRFSLATKIGISTHALRCYESGKTVPKLDVAVRLSKAIGFSLDALSKTSVSEADLYEVLDYKTPVNLQDAYAAIDKAIKEAAAFQEAEEEVDSSVPTLSRGL